MRGVGLLLTGLLLAACAATPREPASSPPPSAPSFAPPPPPAAEPFPAGVATLDAVLRAAEARSPSVEAARAEWEAAAGRTTEAGLWPNPSVELSKEEITTGGSGWRRSETTLGVRQPLVIGDRLDAAVDAARTEERALREAWLAARLAARAEARRLFVEVLALREEIALRRELAKRAEETSEIARVRFENRAAPESDLIRARNDTAGLRLEIVRLQERADEAATELSALLGNVALSPESLAGELPPPPSPPPDLETRLARDHPAVRTDLLEAEALEGRAAALAAANTPDLAVRVAGGYSGEARAGLVELGLEAELPVFSRHQGAIREAKALARARRAEAEGTARRLVAELRAARRSLASAAERRRRYEEDLRPAAERALAQAREGYRAGNLAFLELLDAQRTLFTTRVGLLGARHDQSRAAARIESLMETP